MSEEMSEDIIKQINVAKLDLKKGNVLVVKLGGFIDGVDWVPTREYYKETHDQIRNVLDTAGLKDVQILVTHKWVDFAVVTQDEIPESDQMIKEMMDE